ncbi:MAG TPA: DUF748 domain-containing protein, partial [Deltaproteobacteria bacterium]|nr:DUF748 domain-containing protein [Deltaproteobacteria bacterium]
AVTLLVSAAIGMKTAVATLGEKVEQALGPGSEIASISVGFSGVYVEGLRVRAQGKWPARDTLRAERVRVVPSLRSLFSGQYRVRSVIVEEPYLSIYRTPAGKVLVVPSLLNRDSRGAASRAPAGDDLVTIGRITLKDAVIEFFDASVARPPAQIRLEQIQATLRNLDIPAYAGRSEFSFTGVARGVHTSGTVDIRGWVVVASRDSEVTVRLRTMDLAALSPYLNRSGDVKVLGGTLDVDVASEVKKGKIRAPGTITIADLELAPSPGLFGTFMGVPRDAVLTFLRDSQNRISLDFVLEGDMSDPRFTLHEAFSRRLAASMAEVLNVGIKGVAEGAGTLGRKGADAAGDVVKGVGNAVEQFFGGGRD